MHDSSLASALLDEHRAKHIIADKAYDDLAFIRLVEATGAAEHFPGFIYFASALIWLR